MRDCASLEISMRHDQGPHYMVGMRFTPPDSDEDVSPLGGSERAITVDFDRGRELAVAPREYGQWLGDTLFGDPDLERAFGEALAISQGRDIPLQVRLRVAANAAVLHQLRWEALRLPADRSLVTTSERVYFSRYLAGKDWTSPRPQPRRALRALVVIASPDDIGSYEPSDRPLAPIDASGEHSRVREVLGDIPMAALAEPGQATLENILQHLREGYDILYLICHGALIGGNPVLYLTDDTGNTTPVSGDELSTRLKELDRRPLLAVLASCQSAGRGGETGREDDSGLSALGPRLIDAGVPAVVAMQGDIGTETALHFTSVFFQDLVRDGQIDRAMAVARGAVRDDLDAWKPVLFMRLKSGRLFRKDAETVYLEWLVSKLSELKGVKEYIDINAIADATGSPLLGRVDEWGYSAWFRPKEEKPERPRALLASVAQALEQYERFVLLGEPGAGKTTTIRRLALELASQRLEDPSSAPLPLMLDLPEWRLRSLGDTVRAELRRWSLFTEPGLATEAIRDGQVCLFLDGLNEMGGDSEQKAQELNKWVSSVDGPARVIVTCRRGDYGDELRLDNMPTVLLQDLKAAQIRQFAANYLGMQADAFLARILPESEDQRFDSRFLSSIAPNPYMLSALAYIYQHLPDGDLPRNLGTVCDGLVRMLWGRERRRGTVGEVTFGSIESSLAELAFTMIEKNQPTDLPHGDMVEKLGDELLRVAVSANYLTVLEDRVQFYHQLLQEYFAAVKLKDIGLSQVLTDPDLAHWGRQVGRWDQSIIAYCGIVAEPEASIKQIMEQDPCLAVLCAFSGVDISDDLQRMIISNLFEWIDSSGSESLGLQTQLSFIKAHSSWRSFWEKPDPGESTKSKRIALYDTLRQAGKQRIAIYDTLLQAGKPVVPYLVTMLQEGGMKSDDEEVAFTILGNIGDSTIEPFLVDIIGKAELSGLKRQRAILALRNLDARDAIPALMGIVRTLEQHGDTWLAHTAITVLGELNVAESISDLLGIVRDGKQRLELRLASALAIGEIGDTAAVPDLVRILGDVEEDRQVATTKLRRAAPHVGMAAGQAGVAGWAVATSLAAGPAAPILVPLWLALGAKAIYDRVADVKEAFELPNIRVTAAKVLAQLGDSRAILGLLHALRDPSEAVRVQAERSLVSMEWQAQSAEEKVLYHAGFGEWEQCVALGDDAVPILLQLAEDRDRGTVVQALLSLGKIGATDAIPTLAHALRDDEKLVAASAEQALSDIGVEALPSLFDALDSGDQTLRERAASALGKMGEITIPDLRDRLSHEDSAVRRTAARLLRDVQWQPGTQKEKVLYAIARQDWVTVVTLGDAPLPHLLGALADSDRTVGRSAARALGSIGNAEAVAGLLQVLDNPDKGVRKATVEALGKLGDVDAVPGLLSALYDDDRGVRKSAAGALVQIGDAAVPGLVDLLSHIEGNRTAPAQDRLPAGKARHIRRLVLKALKQLDGPTATAFLKERRKH